MLLRCNSRQALFRCPLTDATHCVRSCASIDVFGLSRFRFFRVFGVANSLNPALHPQSVDAPSKDEVTIPFAEFVRRHHPELLRYLRMRVRNEADAADLAQECYARLLRYQTDHSAASLQLLLFRIARNLLTDSYRTHEARRTDQHVSIDDVELMEQAPTQFDTVHGQQRLARLKTAVQRLPPRCQAVFVFSRIDGLSNAEIAQKCGISVNAVEKQITKALAACRAVLGDDAP
jgi:RNA polymerase sigma factor (sigma-70 family)